MAQGKIRSLNSLRTGKIRRGDCPPPARRARPSDLPVRVPPTGLPARLARPPDLPVRGRSACALFHARGCRAARARRCCRSQRRRLRGPRQMRAPRRPRAPLRQSRNSECLHRRACARRHACARRSCSGCVPHGARARCSACSRRVARARCGARVPRRARVDLRAITRHNARACPRVCLLAGARVRACSARARVGHRALARAVGSQLRPGQSRELAPRRCVARRHVRFASFRF